jgi:hypothetical protein
MRPLDHVPASAAQVGNDKLAADLTVHDVVALPEVASWSEPGAHRQAARLALTEARRNSWDMRDPAWAQAKTWSSSDHQPPDDVRYVVDCDGMVWQRHLDERDAYGPLPVDAWSPRRRSSHQPQDEPTYRWAELITHLGPLTACARYH